MTKLNKEDKMFARHGDLILRPVKSVKGRLVKHDGRFILALGERTGHHHMLKGQFKVRETAEHRYLIVEVASLLSHQEHDTITIEPGTYEIDHEREFDYELKGIRRVVD